MNARQYQLDAIAAVRTACAAPVKPRDKAADELRRLRECIARARAQAVRVELPDGPMWLVPAWFMTDDP